MDLNLRKGSNEPMLTDCGSHLEFVIHLIRCLLSGN